MKLSHIIKNCVLVALLAMFVGCKDDKPAEIVKEQERLKLELSDNYVKIKVEENATIDIKQGEGDYKVFSLNNDVAKVEYTNGKIHISGIEKGLTNVIVSDKESQYQQVKVAVYMGELTVDKDNLDVNIRLGHKKTEKIEILSGNDGYVVTSSNEDVVSAEIEDNSITLTFKKAGEAKLKVRDMLEFEKEISVKVSSTTVPFSAEELDKIMEEKDVHFMFNDRSVKGDDYGYKFYNTEEDGKYLYGWDYYGFYFLKIWFTGGKDVGKKEGSQLSFSYWTESFENQPIDLEIIKNDGTYIWSTFSFVKEEKLNYGYFIQKINP